MFSAIYNKKKIFSFEITNMYGLRILEKEKEFRLAGHKGKLLCPECNSEVFLKAGKVKVPHFAHRKNNYSCDIKNKSSFESEEHKKGVQIIFNLIREKGYYETIDIDYYLPFKRRANIFIKSEIIMTFEYIANPMNYNEWHNKQKAYEENNIHCRWILSRKRFNEMNGKDYNFFEKTVSLSDKSNVLIILDTNSNELVIGKYMQYLVKDNTFKKSFFKETISLENIKLTVNNDISVEKFLLKYDKANSTFQKKAEKEYKKHIEKIKRRNENREKKKSSTIRISKTSGKRMRKRKVSFNHSKEKFAYCIDCGEYTNKWWYYEPPNKCRCYCTIENGPKNN